MKGIECALIGTLAHDAELRRSAAGREWLFMSLLVGEGPDAQFLTAGSWLHTIHDLAPALRSGTQVYLEGKIKLSSWPDPTTRKPFLSVQASVVQPMGLIGERRPKRARAPAKRTAYQTSAAVHAPLPFNDKLDF